MIMKKIICLLLACLICSPCFASFSSDIDVKMFNPIDYMVPSNDNMLPQINLNTLSVDEIKSIVRGEIDLKNMEYLKTQKQLKDEIDKIKLANEIDKQWYQCTIATVIILLVVSIVSN